MYVCVYIYIYIYMHTCIQTYYTIIYVVLCGVVRERGSAPKRGRHSTMFVDPR